MQPEKTYQRFINNYTPYLQSNRNKGKGKPIMHLIYRGIIIVALICILYSGARADEIDWIHIDSDEIDLGNGNVQVIINYYYDFDSKDENIVRLRTKTEYVTPLNYGNSPISNCINLVEVNCAKRIYIRLDSECYSEDNVLVKEEKPHKTEPISPDMYLDTLRQHICR
jgi:hypothetical protein